MKNKPSEDLNKGFKWNSQIQIFKEDQRKKEIERQNTEQKEEINKAYKDVINVIANILDDTRKEQANKKNQILVKFKSTKSQKLLDSYYVNKKSIHNNTSHNKSQKVMLLSTLSSKCDESNLSGILKTKKDIIILHKLKSHKKN